MKNITIVFHDDLVRSGATASMLDLISGLKHNYQIRAVIPNRQGDLAAYLKANHIEYIICRYYSNRIRVSNSIFKNIKAILKNLLKIFFSSTYYIKNKKFFSDSDVIYSNTSDNYFGLLASFIFKKPHVLHIREFGLIDQEVIHFIGDMNYYNIALKYSNEVIVISKSLREHITGFISDPELNDKISLIYDDVHFDITNSYISSRLHHIKILVVGTISKGKGQEFVIDAVHELSKRNIEVYLGIAGDNTSSYSKFLMEKVDKLGLSDFVVFHGFCDEMNLLRRQYPVAVVASQAEAFGRVTIEAMGNSQMVIASNTGANPELINEGVNGFLYEQDSISSFCSAIERVISLEEDEFATVVKNGNLFSRSFVGKFASEKISEILMKL